MPACPMVSYTSRLCVSHSAVPASMKDNCQQKNLTASTEPAMPGGTPRFFSEKTCMACAPVAAGVIAP